MSCVNYKLPRSDTVKVNAVAPRMAEHAVQQNTHPPLFGGFAQTAEVLLGPQQRVDSRIISGIIPMVRMGFKNRVEIQAGNTQ